MGKLIVAALLCCVLEGGLRKWVFQNGSPAVQAVAFFSKDVPLMFAALACMALRPLNSALLSKLGQLLGFGTVLYLVGSTIAATQGLSPVGGAVSLRNVLLMPFLAIFLSRGIRGRHDVQLILHTIGFCAVFNAVLGAIQFLSPAEHWLNAQVSDKQEVVSYGGRVRANGTFSWISGMADLCTITCWSAGVLIGTNPRRWFAYAYAVAGLSCAAAAISRGGVAMGMAILSGSLMLQPRTRPIAFLLAALGGGGLVFVAGAGLETSGNSNELSVAEAVVSRHKSNNEGLEERILHMFFGDLPPALITFPIGIGLGMGQTSGAAVTPEAFRMLMIFESEPARVVLEVGIVGLLGVITIRLGTFITLWQHIPSAKILKIAGLHRALWVPTTVLFGMGLFMQVTFNHVQATFQMIALTCLLATTARGEGGRAHK